MAAGVGGTGGGTTGGAGGNSARLQAAGAVLPAPVERTVVGMRRQALHYPEELVGLTRYSPHGRSWWLGGYERRRKWWLGTTGRPGGGGGGAGHYGGGAAHRLIPPTIRVREAAAGRLTQLALQQVLLPGVVKTLETTAIPIMQILQGKEAMEEVPELTANLGVKGRVVISYATAASYTIPLAADPMGASPHPVWSACRPATVRPSLLAPVQTAGSFKS